MSKNVKKKKSVEKNVDTLSSTHNHHVNEQVDYLVQGEMAFYTSGSA